MQNSTINTVNLKKPNARYLSNRQIKQNRATLEGAVVNNFIKDNEAEQIRPNLNDTYNQLLIGEARSDEFYYSNDNKDDFSVKKILTPTIVASAGVFLTATALGVLVNKSAKKITTEPFKNQLQPLGLNINIRQEPEFATYMALRNPDYKNVMAMGAVFAFSAVTLAAKKLVEGFGEVWVKKQEANTQRDLQEKLIQVETQAFSGKLAVVRNMLSQKGEYFKSVIEQEPKNDTFDLVAFKKQFGFMGKNKDDKENNKKINPYFVFAVGSVALAALAMASVVKNFRSGAKIIENYKTSFVDNQQKILNNILENKKPSQKEELANVLIKMGVPKTQAQNYGAQIGLSGDELETFANKVACDVDTLWGTAPTGMSTENGKAFFYCYLNEPRGHLYNYLIHNDNIFLKYLWVAMSLVCGGSFLSQEVAEALKKAAVAKENAKIEYDLQKRLVEVEIQNFKSKKESAIEPLMQEFEHQRQMGKSPEDLKVMADNILLEIKNGPPFVYS